MKNEVEQNVLDLLPGLCLQAELQRWRCSAEPEASESEPHSPDGPSYCLLTVRDKIQLKTECQMQIGTWGEKKEQLLKFCLGFAWE